MTPRKGNLMGVRTDIKAVSYIHLRTHETESNLVCRLLLETKKENHHIVHCKSTRQQHVVKY